MPKVNIVINDRQLAVDSGVTILEAARTAGIHIPTLCHMDGIKSRANCRMCVVEVEKMRGLVPSCAAKVSEGMVIRTDTDNVRSVRKMNLELIMSDHAVDCHHCLRIGSSTEENLNPKFCEMCFFCDCVRDGFCELQALCREYHVDVLPYIQHENEYEIDESLGSVSRNPNKCIKCRRCVDVCAEVQTVHNLSMAHRGRDIRAAACLGKNMAESECVRCGRCVDACPCGALYMKEHIDEVIFTAHSYDTRTAAMIDEAVIPAVSSLFKVDEEAISAGHLSAAMRKIGVDHVVSREAVEERSRAAASKIIDERLRMKERTENSETYPLVITNSFAAKNFVDANFPELSAHVIKYASAQEEFRSYIQEQFPGERIKTIALTSTNEDVAEKEEQHFVDYSMNAREFYRLCMRTGGAPHRRIPADPDLTAGTANSPWDPVLKKESFTLEHDPVTLELDAGGKHYKAAKARNLGDCRLLLEQVKAHCSPYDIIYLQA